MDIKEVCWDIKMDWLCLSYGVGLAGLSLTVGFKGWYGMAGTVEYRPRNLDNLGRCERVEPCCIHPTSQKET